MQVNVNGKGILLAFRVCTTVFIAVNGDENSNTQNTTPVFPIIFAAVVGFSKRAVSVVTAIMNRVEFLCCERDPGSVGDAFGLYF